MSPFPLNQPAKCGPSIAVPSQGHGSFSVSCSTTMAAPPLRCLEVVLNTADYPSWNTFCPRVMIDERPTLPQSPVESSAPELLQLAERPDYLYLGVKFRFDVIMKEGQAPMGTSLEVSLLEKFERDGRTGYRVAWKTRGMTGLVLRAERVQEFVETAEGNGHGTEYYCWETFTGVAARGVRYFVGSQLEDGFQRWMDGVKVMVEKTDEGGGGIAES